MNLDIKFLSETMLFHECNEEDILQMAQLLRFKTTKYGKGAVIFHAGSGVTHIGLVLSGAVQMEWTDVMGNTSLLAIAEAGDIFAETYAMLPREPLLIDVIAREDCEILFISASSLFASSSLGSSCDASCGSSWDCRAKVIQNLVTICAQKNLQLSRRSLHTSPKTIRGRLLSYFSQQISAQGTNTIVIPFNRQQLADYLNLDRSALSKELGKMEKEGLLKYKRNVFEIKAGTE